jgi:hypothetical protein
MPGRTISAFADEETASLVEQLALLEGRTPSQIAASALALYVRLPAEAHASLRYVQAFGTADELARMTREVARAMVDAEYGISRRKALDAMQVDADADGSEEDLLAQAVRAVTGAPPPIRRSGVGREAADSEHRPRRRRG